jgi:DNA-binding beta-propeller fold protein YncE
MLNFFEPEPAIMKTYMRAFLSLLIIASFILLGWRSVWSGGSKPEVSFQKVNRYLYVAVPGVRNYLEYGGHGILVYDIDAGHKLVKRIPTHGLKSDGTPSNVKGVAASVATNCIYISTLEALQCIDLATEKLLWEKVYEGGCDRMAMSPDGKVIYLPSLEKEHWNVVDARTGDVITKIFSNSGAHNTLYGPDGTKVYLAGLRTPSLGVADTKDHTVIRQVGPFTAPVRPFTINGGQTLCYVNINDLLGFEVGDIKTGKKLHRVEVAGFSKGPVKRHGCPSHGIGLTPDESEVWLCDAFNQRLHIYDNTVMPPKQKANVALRDQPGWITFSMDGQYAYPSTGEIIDVKSRKILTALADENGNPVQSEKMVEIHLTGMKAEKAGDQFGIGRGPVR